MNSIITFILSIFVLFTANCCVVQAQEGTFTPIPSTDVTPGEPTCQGDKPGAVNPKIAVPCRCPPTQQALARQVDVKTSISNEAFPLGTDLESRIRRYEITLSALQDLKCPAASTKLKPKLQALTALRGKSSDAIQEAIQGIGFNDAPKPLVAAAATPAVLTRRQVSCN